MRILAYLHNYPPGRLLGGELMTSLLLEALAQRGHDVQVIAHEVHKPYVRNGVRVEPKMKSMLAGDLACDVLISHPEIVGFVRNRVGAASVVTIVHNLQPATLDGLRTARPHLIVANAEATAAKVAHYARRLMVLHPPTPQGRHLSPTGLPRKFITLVNLSEEKGGELFFWLAKQRPDIQFLGVAGGHGEQVRPAEVPANVWLLGQSESMGIVFGLTHTLLMPSATETYGMVGAEAMLQGIPVIANPLPGIREALGDAGLWADRDDPHSWLAAVDRLQDPLEYVKAVGPAQARGELIAKRSASDLQRFCDTVEAL